MTMTPERLAELDAAVARFPVSLPWIFTPTERDGVTGIHGEPHPVGDKFAVAYLADVFGNAAPVVEVMNAIPDLRAMIDAQAATIARLESELEKTTHPHFWWDVDDSENGCDDITSILDNYEVGEVVELSCARNLPNQWAVGYVTESGGFNGQTFATKAEAVAFAAERAALTGAA